MAALFCLYVARASAASAPGPDAFGYTVAPTTNFTFTQITNRLTTGSIKVLTFDDDTTTNANLGFTFNFYGSNYTNLSFSPNGLITFGGQSTAFSNVNLTATPLQTNLPCIAVLWDDWETQDAPADAGVYYATTGSIGSRQFIIQWNKVVTAGSAGADPITFQARLFEGSGKILFSYFDAVISDDTSNLVSKGASATVAIRDYGGQTNNRNLQWSFNQVLITNGLNLLFTQSNHAPLANPDNVTTPEDTSITFAVKSNDTDLDSDPITLVSISQPTNGVAVTNLSQTVTYTAATNFFGTDHFTYVISDGNGGTATGLVTITVSSVNDPPVARPDALNTYANLPLIFPYGILFTNDYDADGNVLNLSSISSASTSGAAVSLSGSNVTYTPLPGFTGADTFNYTITDGSALGTGVVTITVWPLPSIGPVRRTNGHPFLTFQGVSGLSHTVLASTDFTNWTNIGVASEITPGNFVFEDTDASGMAARFYRLRAP